jgi:hypothetical protein
MADPLLTDRALQAVYQSSMPNSGDGHLDAAAWDRIASGQIDPEARDAAFDHVVQCESCSRVWRGLLDLKNEAEAEGLIVGAPATSSWFRSPVAALAVAASVILVSALVVLRQSQTPVAPAPGGASIPAAVPTAPPAFLQAFRLSKADLHVAPEEALAPRGTTALGGEPPLDRLAAALEPYRRDDYAAAVPALAALQQQFPTAGRPGLYLGVSLLHLDRDADAIAPLSVAVTSPIPGVAGDARWYRAIAYARTGQPDAAAADVKILCDTGAADSARACNAMQALAAAPR